MTFFSVFTIKNFRQVWLGQFVSIFGSSAQTIAVSFYLKNLTESGFFVGSVMFLAGLSALFFLPLAGILADRFNRLKIVIFCDSVCAFSTLTMAYFFVLHPSSHSTAYVISAGVIIIRISISFFRPAFGAMFPDLITRELLAPANAFYKSGARIGDLCGATWGGALYKAIGPGSLCLLSSLTYIISILFLSRVGPKNLFSPMTHGIIPKKPLIKKSTKYEFLQGFSVITAMPGGIQFLSLALIVNFLATPIFVLMPFHTSGFLKGGATLYGSLMATLSSGVLTGYLLTAKWPLLMRRNSSYIIVSALVLMCVSFLIFACCKSLFIAYSSLLIAGIANGYWSIFFETALQGAVPRSQLGRVYSCFGLLAGSLIPISSLLGGLILDITNKNTVLLFSTCAIGMTSYAVFMSFNKNFLKFFEYIGSNHSPNKQPS